MLQTGEQAIAQHLLVGKAQKHTLEENPSFVHAYLPLKLLVH